MIALASPDDPGPDPNDTLADSLAAALLPRTEPPVAPQGHPQAGPPATPPTGILALLDAAIVLAAIRLHDRLQRWSASIERRQREQREHRDR